jgi:hypothetical protein
MPKSRLSDYADMSGTTATPEQERQDREPRPAPPAQEEVDRNAELVATDPEPAAEGSEAVARRRMFARLLGEFRRTAMLVPLGGEPRPEQERGLLTDDFNGIRFILAFSDEQSLARYSQARREYAHEWTYRTILGAKLLDVAVPAAGVPCGVALDCADGPDGMVFPPVARIVPDEAAVDRDEDRADGG